MATAVCADFPEAAQKLAKAFWPGPLTIVLPCRDVVPSIVTAGGDTIGVRCPDHSKTLELLRLAGVPAAAPSANISDNPSPKSAEDVLNYFDGKIPCVIDGGACTIGVESTIVSLVAGASDSLRGALGGSSRGTLEGSSRGTLEGSLVPYKILRQGALSENEIKRVLGG